MRVAVGDPYPIEMVDCDSVRIEQTPFTISEQESSVAGKHDNRNPAAA